MIHKKPHSIVGSFIREKRISLGISQRALGQLFEPAVTTQFISNLERGVTPLPLNHVSKLAHCLKITESELMAMLEREYALKLAGKMSPESLIQLEGIATSITVAPNDYDFLKVLYEAYVRASEKDRQTFVSMCETLLKLQVLNGHDGLEEVAAPMEKIASGSN